MVVCSLDMVGSRLKELHSLLLIATELRHLHCVCKVSWTRMLRAKQSARSTLLKVFSLFGSEDSLVPPGAQNKWEGTRDILRHELQVPAPSWPAVPAPQHDRCRCTAFVGIAHEYATQAML